MKPLMPSEGFKPQPAFFRNSRVVDEEFLLLLLWSSEHMSKSVLAQNALVPSALEFVLVPDSLVFLVLLTFFTRYVRLLLISSRF